MPSETAIVPQAADEQAKEEVRALLKELGTDPESPFLRGRKSRLKRFRLLEYLIEAHWRGEFKRGRTHLLREFNRQDAGSRDQPSSDNAAKKLVTGLCDTLKAFNTDTRRPFTIEIFSRPFRVVIKRRPKGALAAAPPADDLSNADIIETPIESRCVLPPCHSVMDLIPVASGGLFLDRVSILAVPGPTVDLPMELALSQGPDRRILQCLWDKLCADFYFSYFDNADDLDFAIRRSLDQLLGVNLIESYQDTRIAVSRKISSAPLTVDARLAFEKALCYGAPITVNCAALFPGALASLLSLSESLRPEYGDVLKIDYTQINSHNQLMQIAEGLHVDFMVAANAAYFTLTSEGYELPTSITYTIM